MKPRRPKDTARSNQVPSPVVRLDYWNELRVDGTMSEVQLLKQEVVAQQRTIEAQRSRLSQDRIDHGQAMYRAMHATERRRWMAEQAKRHEAREGGEEA